MSERTSEVRLVAKGPSVLDANGPAKTSAIKLSAFKCDDHYRLSGTYSLMLPLIQRAKSLVMKPASMVSMHTASRLSENSAKGLLPEGGRTTFKISKWSPGMPINKNTT